MRTVMLGLAFVACGGDGQGTTDDDLVAPTCDEIVTEPLSAVPTTEWPSSLAAGITAYEGLSGRWEVTSSCGGTIGVKLVAQDRESLEVVRQAWTTDELVCGCANDPAFGDDTTLDPMALFEGFEVYIETFDDPGVQGANVIGSGALFTGVTPSFRACATEDLDAAAGSAYDQLTAVIRVVGGTLNGTLVLATDAGEVTTCELSDWQLVEAI